MSYQGQVWVPPTNTSFTSFNSPTVQSVGSNIAMYQNSQSGGSDNIVGQYAVAPSAPYCAIANITFNPANYVGQASPGTMLWGMGFYDGTKLIMLNVRFAETETMWYNITEYSNVNTYFNNVIGGGTASGYPMSTIQWMQVRDDGTNISFYIATDGGQTQPTHWVQLYQQARTSFLSNVNNVFWGLSATNGAVAPSYLTLNSWQIVSL